MAKYPYRSQENAADPVVAAKLFDACGSGTWWVTEYDPEDRILFSFVTGLAEDEWGTASAAELADLRWGPMPRIEIDRSFEPMRMSEVRKKYPHFFAKATG